MKGLHSWAHRHTPASVLLGSFLILTLITHHPVFSMDLDQFSRGEFSLLTQQRGIYSEIQIGPNSEEFQVLLRADDVGYLQSGLGLGDCSDLPFTDTDWSLYPLALGEIHPYRKPRWYLGINANYLDYQIGTWLTRLNLSLLAGPQGYQGEVSGSYSIGNTVLSGDMIWCGGQTTQWWSPKKDQRSFWEPFRRDNFGLLPVDKQSNFGNLTIDRKVDIFSDPLTLSFSAASKLDSRPPDLFFAGALDSKPYHGRLYFEGVTPTAGLVSASYQECLLSLFAKPGKTYNLLLAHSSNPSLRLEVLNRAKGPSIFRLKMGVKW